MATSSGWRRPNRTSTSNRPQPPPPLFCHTRQYIQLLVAGGAQGIGGRGVQLGNALRRFEPFVEYTAKLNKALAGRRNELAKVIHDFGELTPELGKHDAQIRTFVTSSDKALGNFANQQEAVQEAFEHFPSTLRAAR